MKQEFASGLFYWWRGWCWLWRSRALGFYAVLPFVMAVAFFVSVFWLTVHYMSFWTNHFVTMLLPTHAIWSGVLYYPAWLTFFLLTFVATVYLSYLIHIILCGPFYSILAERALHDLGKQDRHQFHFSLRVLLGSLLKSFLFLAVGAGLFLFSVVPLINVVGFVMALLILAFDTMDYSFEAMGMGLSSRLRYFFRHFPQWLGMATSLALTLIIPGLTLLILPGAVVGAAMILDNRSPAVSNSI